MKTVNVGIIGYGKVAHLHARALKSIESANLVAVQGRDLTKAQQFAGQYDLRAYTDLEEMINQSGVQAIVVCTPHPAHASSAVVAANLGVHVLVEKPLAASLEDCDKMIDAAQRNGVLLGVISQRRFYEPVLRVRQAIDEGKIGTPILGSVIMYGWRDEKYYRSDPWRGKWETEGGGVLVNQSPHPLDLLHWFMGPIDSIFGYWGNLNHPYIEVEDTAVAVLRFKNGGLGSIVVSNSQKPGIYGKVHIHGSNGATLGVQTEGGAMFIAGMSNILEPPVNDLWTVPGEEDFLQQWQEEDKQNFEQVNPEVHYLRLQNADFIDAIIQGRQPAVTGEDGRETVEIFTAIYRSQQTQAQVQLPLLTSI